ncbi:MAG: Bax inhibitor-1/YccA family protein [Planctomycetes bacterium]|nr:Bax inhibitor-1/YccA family protein [Planctomycetota bacterium]
MNYQNKNFGSPPPTYGAQFNGRPGYGVQQGYAQSTAGPVDLYGSEQVYDGSLSDPAVIAFTKRVYAYFTGGLLLATMAAIGGVYGTNYLVASGQAKLLMPLAIGAGIANIITYLVILFTRRNHSPFKLGLMVFYAATLGVTLGPILSVYVAQGMASVIAAAFGITTVIFFGLTVFTLVTGKDFRSIGGYLIGGVLLMLGLVLMSIFVPFGSMMTLVFCGLGIAISVGYILWMTSQVTREYFYVQDAITPAVVLLTSFVNLFWYILRILGDRR